MKRKGFTLVELLVVIAIIALLMGILMPALARVRQLAFRMTCGTNLSGIGKAMLIYANDYEDELPRAGGRNTTWGQVKLWSAPTRMAAYGVAADGTGGTASISSCFYLLVKYAEVTPKSFICKGDSGTTEFKLADQTLPRTDFELIDAWDFGLPASSWKSCSYSYHLPFGMYALTVSSEPGFAVAADRNPWFKSPAGDPGVFNDFVPDLTTAGNSESAKKGNAIAHQLEGQNVMFLDTHVEFEKRPYCSVEDDNIYTTSGLATGGHAKGVVPTTTLQPQSRKDSFLVHDPDVWGGTTPPAKRPPCFVGDTLTWVDGQAMPIGQVVAGQGVAMPQVNPVAYPGRAQQIENVDVHVGVFDGAFTVILENGESFCVVGSHVFLLDSGAWVPVEALHAGSVLRTHAGPIRVQASLWHSLPYIGTVYNLKVKDADHYFVGLAGVVVRDY